MMGERYDHKEIEPKWKEAWEKTPPYKAIDFDKKPKFYALVEFPYCSGEGLHMGHAFTNTLLDVLARKKRMDGFNVLHPMGWDSFGLPTENYAIKTGTQPAEITARNTKRFKETDNKLGISYNWEREIDTSDPKYYRWTQWIFLQLYKKGLAYKAETPVGWCPSCKIILANEEIVDGKCERCGTGAEHRTQKQWILKITAYADRLADELDLVDYPDYVKASQRKWIGRSEGVHLEFRIKNYELRIKVFTTAIDTVFGTTFMVIAPEYAKKLSDLIPESNKRNVSEYIETALKKSERERQTEEKTKTGVDTGLKAINPFSNKEMPIYVADYVLEDYGTGAVMGVPGHDARDYEFAKKYNLEVIPVIQPNDEVKDRAKVLSDGFWDYPEVKIYADRAVLFNSGEFDGLTAKEAKKKLEEELVRCEIGEKTVSYHLRDWIFSRQHYWGEPIPIVHCQKCGIVPVPEDQLPVELPYVEKYQPTETGESPLANIKEWVKIACPECGGEARRETDTMPNWAGSSWYYLAYVLKDQINNATKEVRDIFSENQKLLEYWSPVDIYLGGAEHTTLHLLYSRFWHKFLNDIGVVPGKEPYASRRQHGVILGEDGFRMSKSRGNILNPEEMINAFGADTLRIYLLFMGPYDSTMPWETASVEGCQRFLKRIWILALRDTEGLALRDTEGLALRDAEGLSCTLASVEGTSDQLSQALHKVIKKVGDDIDAMKFNTAIAAMMEFINIWQKDEKGLSKEDLKKFLLILAPFAPFIAEELYSRVFPNLPNYPDRPNSIHSQSWPKFDEDLLEDEEVIVVIQVNGKLRAQIQIPFETARTQAEVEQIAKEQEGVLKYLEGKEIKKVIFVPGKLVNFVI